MIKHIITLGAFALAPAAIAQTATHDGAHNPAVKDSAPAAVSAPAAGANSFSEDQAHGRLTKAGYSAITGLKKDENGVWRGTAMHDGKKVNVALDYKGNVTAH